MRLVKQLYLLFGLLVTLLIVFKSTEYLQPNFSSGFLLHKKAIFPSYKFALYAHMIAAPISFFTGCFQFIWTRSRWHKSLGKLYVFAILGFAAPGAFFMAFYAIGGAWSVINFILMTLLWIGFTWQAYYQIRLGHVKAHQQFMVRSFILTNSAILIRLFSFINHQYIGIDPVQAYVFISWFSWLPWLLGYEMVLRFSSEQ